MSASGPLVSISTILAHLSQRLPVRYRMGLKPVSVRLKARHCVHTFKQISFETSRLIKIKFHLGRHWEGDWLYNVLGKIRSDLWFPWQQIAPIGL